MSRASEPPPPSTGVVATSPTDRQGTGATGLVNTAPMPRVDTLIGKVLNGRYRVTELVAKGGMGRVYKAEQSPLGRVVALKVLDGGSDAGQDSEFRGRFMLEAAATAKLTHPNTIRIFDYGRTQDDICYIAMEYLDGRTLHQALKDDGPLAPDRVVNIIRQVCASLREAHGLGLIHRDLKPSNVVLLRTGEEAEFAKVLDFGLVKEISGKSELTRVDAVVGSPSYMSPEQIRSTHVDNRSDIYSLGVLMYTCLVGKPPFTGVSSVNLLMAHLHSVVPPIGERAPLERTPTLEWAVMTCLEKEPDARFANVDELNRALRIASAELRGEKPARPTLVNGRLSVPEEPTPSSSMRIAQPSGAKPVPGAKGAQASIGPRRDEASGSRSSTGRPKASRAYPLWAALGIAVAAIVLLSFIAIAAGGVYFRGVNAVPASEPVATPVVAPAPAPAAALPGAKPATPSPAKAAAPAAPPPQAPSARPASPKPAPAAAAKPAASQPAAPAPEPAPAPHSDLKNPWN